MFSEQVHLLELIFRLECEGLVGKVDPDSLGPAEEDTAYNVRKRKKEGLRPDDEGVPLELDAPRFLLTSTGSATPSLPFSPFSSFSTSFSSISIHIRNLSEPVL
jgi:hypothetical protein